MSRVLLAAVFMAAVSVASAYNHKWTGAASGEWNQGQNWTNGVPNPGENRAMRLYFPADGFRLDTRQSIEGLVVDFMEVRSPFHFAGGPGAKLSFRDTNDVASAYVSLEVDAGATFESDLEIGLTTPIGVFAQHTQIPNAVAGYFEGRITGPGAFHLYGGGTVEFGGSGANSYGGVTAVHSGTLRLNKDGATAVPHSLEIGIAMTGGLGSKVLCVRDGQFGSGTHVTINRTGWLNLDGHSHTVGSLTLGGGRVSAGTGVLTLAGNVTANPGTTNSLIEGLLFFGVSPRSFNVGGDSPTNGLEVTGQIFGGATATLVKDGPGWLTLGGSNTYLGLTLINDGVLRASGPNPLGGVDQGTVVNAGGTLFLPAADVGDEPLSLSGQGYDNLGALYAFGDSASSGHIALPSEAVISVWPFSTLTLSGVVSGPGGLRVRSGTVRLSGTSANTFSGPTRVDGGTLELRKQILILEGNLGLVGVPGPLFVGDGSGSDSVRLLADNGIADSSAVTLASSGLLDLNSHDDTIGSLSGDGGQVTLGDGQLTIGANGGSTTTAAAISGAGGRLRKVGPGTLTLTAQNTYSGATTVEMGALIVDGIQAASAVVVKANATLAGSGTVGAITAQGGVVSPGHGVGRLSCQGVTLNSAAVFSVEIRGAVAGTDHDQLKVTGPVNLGGSALEAGLGFRGAAGNHYTLISNDGSDAVNGTFAGKPEGSSFAAGGATFQISYAGGDGNDVVLTQLTESTQDFAPVLAITPVPPSGARLSWSTNAVGFQLQSALAVPSVEWTGVVVPPVVMGASHTVTLPATNACAVYRLFKP